MEQKKCHKLRKAFHGVFKTDFGKQITINIVHVFFLNFSRNKNPFQKVGSSFVRNSPTKEQWKLVVENIFKRNHLNERFMMRWDVQDLQIPILYYSRKSFVMIVKKNGVALPELIVSPSFPSGNLGCMTEGVGGWGGVGGSKLKTLLWDPKFLHQCTKILQNLFNI